MQNESPYRMIIFNSCMAKKVLTLQNAADGKTVNWIKKKPTNHKKYIPKIWAQSVKRSRSSFPSKFKLIPFIGLGGIVSSRFEFNWRRCLGAVMQKLSNQGTIRNILTKFQLNPFSGLWGIVIKRFEFNWCSRLGAVMQKLSR